jgi:hypothetical protein
MNGLPFLYTLLIIDNMLYYPVVLQLQPVEEVLDVASHSQRTVGDVLYQNCGTQQELYELQISPQVAASVQALTLSQQTIVDVLNQFANCVNERIKPCYQIFIPLVFSSGEFLQEILVELAKVKEESQLRNFLRNQ